MRVRFAGPCVLLAAALAASGSLAQSPEASGAASEWRLRESEDRCSIEHSLVEAGQPYNVSLVSYGPDAPYQAFVRSPAIPARENRSGIAPIGFGGPDEAEETVVIIGASRGTPTLIFEIAPSRSFNSMARLFSGGGFARYVVPGYLDAGRLSLDLPDMEPVTLALGGLEEAAARLDDCARRLAARWTSEGAAAVAPPRLTNAQDVSAVLYYPPNYVLNRVSSIVFMRMDVDQQGKVASCHVQAPNWGGTFESETCKNFKRQARFEPARDAAGNAVPGVYQMSMMYAIYDW